MEAKKSKKSDLESRKNIFFQTGVIITLLLVLMAFNIKQSERRRIEIDSENFRFYDVDQIPITIPEKPKPEKPSPSDKIIIVPDDTKIDVDVNIDMEAFIDFPIPDYKPYIYDEKPIDSEIIFVAVQENPEFPGGRSAMYRYLNEELKYPRAASRSGIFGTVYLTFVVEPDGSITNIEVLRGIGSGCNEEAVRVIENMPKWKPGKQMGVPVRVLFSMPIKFVLN